MKPKKIKLQLNKETIAKLNDVEMGNLNGGGVAWFTQGCTDGCDLIGKTKWNCTKADCTADCGTIACDTKAFCTIIPDVNQDDTIYDNGENPKV